MSTSADSDLKTAQADLTEGGEAQRKACFEMSLVCIYGIDTQHDSVYAFVPGHAQSPS
jgi:hypothetical protein